MSDKPREVKELPRPVDTTAALLEAVELIRPLGLQPVLIGGVALSVYGIERYTKDVDLALTVSEVGKAATVLGDKDPRPLRIGGISFMTSSGVRVDLIDRRVNYQALFEEAIAAARQSGPLGRVGALELPVIPLVYLVAFKLVADRDQDELDLQRLLRREDLDYAAAREIVERRLGVFAAERLDRLARKAGRQDTPKEYEEEDS